MSVQSWELTLKPQIRGNVRRYVMCTKLTTINSTYKGMMGGLQN